MKEVVGPTEKPIVEIRGLIYECCNVEFEAQPRIDANSINRGVSAEQIYCPEHQTPKAVSHRQVLNRSPKKESKRAKAYRKTPRADKLRERQRLRAAEVRRLAKEAKILRALNSKPLSWRRIVPLLLIDRELSNEEVQNLAGLENSRPDKETMRRIRAFCGVSGGAKKAA